MAVLQISAVSRAVAGILLLSVVGVELGGRYNYGVVLGEQALTDFQQAFARAGHAHAGVLVTLSLVVLLWADVASLGGVLGWIARLGVPAAAVLMPAGFFLSSLGAGATRPNGFVALLWTGGACLAIGVVTLGLGLLLRRPGG